MGDDVSYIDSLRTSSADLAAAARAAGLDAEVPPCPGWTVGRLLSHIGRVHTSAEAVVRARGPVDFDALPKMPRDETAIADFERRAGALAEALSGLPEDEPVWNWLGIDPPPAGFYHRRMAQETAVHRWDAQAALGPDAATPVAVALAVDGVDEFLEVFLPHVGSGADLGGSLHLHATDTDCEWIVERQDDRLVAVTGHAKADAAIRGTASDLLLFLWNRVPAPSPHLDVVGDAAVATAWAERVRL